MSGLELNSVLTIVLIIVIVFAILFLIYKTVFEKKVNDKIDVKIEKALKAAGIIVPTSSSEHFQDTIVYDSFNKINDNFINFINLFYPLLDINKINNIIKENTSTTSPTDIQSIINNKEIDALKYILGVNDSSNNVGGMVFRLFIMSIFANNNDTDIILFGLAYVIIIREMLKTERPNFEHKLYYLNDYSTAGDFIIYFINDKFTEDIQSASVRNKIPELMGTEEILPNAFKYFVKKIVKEGLIENEFRNFKERNVTTSSAGQMTQAVVVTDNELNIFIASLKNNTNDLLNLYRIMFSNMFLSANGTLSNNSNIITNFIDLMYSDKFTTDIRTFLNLPPIGTTISSNNINNMKSGVVNSFNLNYTTFVSQMSQTSQSSLPTQPTIMASNFNIGDSYIGDYITLYANNDGNETDQSKYIKYKLSNAPLNNNSENTVLNIFPTIGINKVLSFKITVSTGSSNIYNIKLKFFNLQDQTTSDTTVTYTNGVVTAIPNYNNLINIFITKN